MTSMPRHKRQNSDIVILEEFSGWWDQIIVQLRDPQFRQRVEENFDLIMKYKHHFHQDIQIQLDKLKHLIDTLWIAGIGSQNHQPAMNQTLSVRMILMMGTGLDIEVKEYIRKVIPHLDGAMNLEKSEVRCTGLIFPRLGPFGLLSEFDKVIESFQLHRYQNLNGPSNALAVCLTAYRASLAYYERQRGTETRLVILQRLEAQRHALSQESRSYHLDPLLRSYRVYLEDPKAEGADEAIRDLEKQKSRWNAREVAEMKIKEAQTSQERRLKQIDELKAVIRAERQVSDCIRQMSLVVSSTEALAYRSH